MSYKPSWDNGGWKTVCDSCGRVFKNNELQLRWDGLMVCSGDWEIRQPQDFVHGVADIQAPPFTRPESSDSFIPIAYTQQPNETIDVTEVLAKIFTRAAESESVTVTESVSLEANNSNAESISISETVSSLLVSSSAINGSAINSLGIN
jgi:hypothetical protein